MRFSAISPVPLAVPPFASRFLALALWMAGAGFGGGMSAAAEPAAPRISIEQPAGVPQPGGVPVVAWGDDAGSELRVPEWVTNIRSVAAGYSHIAAIRTDGTVIAWGSNNLGQLDAPAGLAGVKALALGDAHTAALKEDGTVVVWGDSTRGQAAVPAGLSGVQAVSANISRTLALKSDGTVVGWGESKLGPIEVPADLAGVQAISTSGTHEVALKEDGTVVAWGSNAHGQTSVPAGLSGVVAVAAGSWHTLALKGDGTVVAWGSNVAGQTAVPAGLTGVKAIAAGNFHSVALKNDGTVVCWGPVQFGAAKVPAGLSGVGAISAAGNKTVAMVPGTSFVDFGIRNLDDAGLTKTFTIKNTGTATLNYQRPSLSGTNPDDFVLEAFPGSVFPGGRLTLTVTFRPRSHGRRGAILRITSNDPARPLYKIALTGGGIDTVPPVFAPPPNLGPLEENTLGGAVIDLPQTAVTDNSSDYIQIKYSVALGSVFPVGTTTVTASATDFAKNVTTHTFSVTVKGVPRVAIEQEPGVPLRGNVVAWGSNSERQTTGYEGLVGAKAIAAGGTHALALRGDGTVAAWGSNLYGQCDVPAGLSGVAAIAAAGRYSVALRTDGTLAAWGSFAEGLAYVPAGVENLKAIAAGSTHLLALRNDGTLAEWGSRLPGINSGPAGLTNIKAIAAGQDISAALRNDGIVVVWRPGFQPAALRPTGWKDLQAIAVGDGYLLGLLQDGTVLDYDFNEHWSWSRVPAGLKNVTAIAAGSNHAMALRSDGTLVLWGANTDGQNNAPAGLGAVQAIDAGGTFSLALTNSSPSVDFGSVGQADFLYGVRRLTIRNAGTAPLELRGVSIESSNKSFDVSPSGLAGSLLPGASATLAVSFKPGKEGPLSALLRVRTNDPVTPSFEVALSGTGLPVDPPRIEAHADVTAEATDAEGAIVTYAPATVGGDYGKLPELLYSKASGTRFPIGVTPVTITAIGALGGTLTASFKVTVVDTTAPLILWYQGEDIEVKAQNAEGALVSYAFTKATDAVTSNPILHFSRASGTRFPIGVNVVTITASDKAGNSASKSFKVTVKDSVAPGLSVERPGPGAGFPTGVVEFSGAATDDLAVARVEVVLNGGAPFVTGFENAQKSVSWKITVTPDNGPNTAVVTAYDRFGNASEPVIRRFTSTVSRPEIAGVYGGLLSATPGYPDPIEHEGFVTLTLRSTGVFTGKVTVGGRVTPMSGVLLNDGRLRFHQSGGTLLRISGNAAGGGPLSLALHLATAPGAEKFSGSLTLAGTTVASLEHAGRALYTAAQNPLPPFLNVPLALRNPQSNNGHYTALFSEPNNGAGEFPKGKGWARMTVGSNGVVRLAGKLADGSTLSFSHPILNGNELPIHGVLSGGAGMLAGSLVFDRNQTLSDAAGSAFKWFKRPEAGAALYPAGWLQGIPLEMSASTFVTYLPVAGLNALRIPGVAAPLPNAVLTLSDGLPPAPISHALSIGANSKATPIGATGLQLTIGHTTGLVSGRFLHPGNQKAVFLSGVVFQKTRSAGGFSLYSPAPASTVSGSVEILPVP